MMVRLPTFATYPGSTIVTLSGPQPRTAAEARRVVQEANAAAKREREAKEQQHQARQRELDAMTERARQDAGTLRATRASSAARRRGPRLDVSAVYASRRAETTTADEGKRPVHDHATTTPAPRRARTLAQVARDYYGGGDQGGELIAARPRGGA